MAEEQKHVLDNVNVNIDSGFIPLQAGDNKIKISSSFVDRLKTFFTKSTIITEKATREYIKATKDAKTNFYNNEGRQIIEHNNVSSAINENLNFDELTIYFQKMSYNCFVNNVCIYFDKQISGGLDKKNIKELRKRINSQGINTQIDIDNYITTMIMNTVATASNNYIDQCFAFTEEIIQNHKEENLKYLENLFSGKDTTNDISDLSADELLENLKQAEANWINIVDRGIENKKNNKGIFLRQDIISQEFELSKYYQCLIKYVMTKQEMLMQDFYNKTEEYTLTKTEDGIYSLNIEGNNYALNVDTLGQDMETIMNVVDEINKNKSDQAIQIADQMIDELDFNDEIENLSEPKLEEFTAEMKKDNQIIENKLDDILDKVEEEKSMLDRLLENKNEMSDKVANILFTPQENTIDQTKQPQSLLDKVANKAEEVRQMIVDKIDNPDEKKELELIPFPPPVPTPTRSPLQEPTIEPLPKSFSTEIDPEISEPVITEESVTPVKTENIAEEEIPTNWYTEVPSYNLEAEAKAFTAILVDGMNVDSKEAEELAADPDILNNWINDNPDITYASYYSAYINGETDQTYQNYVADQLIKRNELAMQEEIASSFTETTSDIDPEIRGKHSRR